MKNIVSRDVAGLLSQSGWNRDTEYYWQQYYVEGRKGEGSVSCWKITAERTESKKGLRCYPAPRLEEVIDQLTYAYVPNQD